MAEEHDDVEVAWARIVADYDREVTDPVSRWPVDEDIADAPVDAPADVPRDAPVDAPADVPVDAPDDATTSGRSRSDQPVRRLGPDTADDGLGSSERAGGERADAGRDLDRDTGGDAEHHFVPPVPPPLPRPDLPTGLAWAGVLGGPVVLLLAAVLTWDLPRLLTAACIVGFVGGMVFLVANMDDGSGRDGWDDGAQV